MILAGSVVGFASNSDDSDVCDGEKKYTYRVKESALPHPIAQMKLLSYDQLRALSCDQLQSFLEEEEQPSDDDQRASHFSGKEELKKCRNDYSKDKQKFPKSSSCAVPKPKKEIRAENLYEIYEDKIKALNEIYKELDAVNREDVSNMGLIYHWFDKITNLKKGIVEKYEYNPFAVDNTSTSYKLKKAIKRLSSFTTKLHEMKQNLPRAMKRKTKAIDEANAGERGDLGSIKDIKRRRRRLPIIENPEPNALDGLIMILILILFLLCAFVVSKFLRSKRASVPEAKRASLNAAEIMV